MVNSHVHKHPPTHLPPLQVQQSLEKNRFGMGFFIADTVSDNTSYDVGFNDADRFDVLEFFFSFVIMGW